MGNALFGVLLVGTKLEKIDDCRLTSTMIHPKNLSKNFQGSRSVERERNAGRVEKAKL
jgi:hypothetical protein